MKEKPPMAVVFSTGPSPTTSRGAVFRGVLLFGVLFFGVLFFGVLFFGAVLLPAGVCSAQEAPVATGQGASGSVGVAGGVGEAGLPPAECVRLLRRAAIHHEQGEHEAERGVAHQAREAFPGQVLVLAHLLSFYRQHEDSLSEAEGLVREMVERLGDPRADWSPGVLAPLVAAAEGDPAILRAVGEHLVRVDGPEGRLDRERATILALVAAELDDLDLEIRALERMAAPEAGTGGWATVDRWRLNRAYREAGRFEESLALLRQWLELETTPGVLRDYLRTLADLGRADEVLSRLGKAEAEGLTGLDFHSPITPAFVVELAWTLRENGQGSAAETLFRKALQWRPDHAETRAILLYHYGTAEEIAAFEAQEADRRGAETDPQALFEEGTQLLTAGDAAAAFELLRRAVESLPQSKAAWYNLGMAAYRLEDWTTTAEAFGRAAQLEEGRAESHFFRGLALEKLGQCGEAVVALERALELDSSRVIGHYYLASCYRSLGQAEKSRHHSQKYQASQQ